jgi:adenine-specific DNA-methyltransferase
VIVSAHTRLELVWPNKDKFLLIPKDENGKPVWVERTDPSALEVRLAEFGASHGKTSDENPYADNLLFHGDSLDVLRILNETPEYRAEYRGKVKLVYIDPPFNTGQAFADYDDWLESSTWLSFIRERLLFARDLLRDDGSIWLHLDDAQSGHARSLMDELFGADNFVTTIYWMRKDTRANDAKHFSPNTDQIHVYARDKRNWELNRLERTPEMDEAYKNPDNDPRGVWRPGPIYAKSGSDSEFTFTFSNGLVWSPPPGKFSAFSRERLAAMDADNRIYFGKDGAATQPLGKQFLSERLEGVVPTNNWHYEDVGSNRHSRYELKKLFADREPFATPKPERLMERIIHIATNPGDVVLDCFAGSGTTAAVAHKMNRRWVTGELNGDTINAFTRPRLERVVDGTDTGGITSSVEWTGGGGFRLVNVYPSLYESNALGLFVADWPSPIQLRKAIAAQLGFTYMEADVFSGSKGRMRLCILDSPCGPEEALDIASRLEDDERVTIVAPIILNDAEDALKAASKGSRVLKMPRDVLAYSSRKTRGSL